ncbi:MAG: putative LPS assembly protein LptD [Chitinophagaceae bacterium]
MGSSCYSFRSWQVALALLLAVSAFAFGLPTHTYKHKGNSFLLRRLLADTSKPTTRRNQNVNNLTVNNAKPSPQVVSDTTINNIINDSSRTKMDSGKVAKVDTLLISKDSLDAPVEYSADDSGVLIINTNQFFLYGKASVAQKDVKLDAGTIFFDQGTQVVKAFGAKDTATANMSDKPTITQNGTTSINDTIYFNLQTQKGLLKNSYYQEGDMFVNAEKLKKIDKNVAFGYRTIFTTCNLDTPHFNFRARKVKLVANKVAVSGPAHPEFEGVPMPIAIPFGIFPLTSGRHSGILPPQFATNADFGLGLENFGYYKVLSPYWDVTTRASFYSYGGWNLTVNPNYFKRYKYRGTFNLNVQNTRLLNRNFIAVGAGAGANEEFISNRSFQVFWTHTQDGKARPGTNFSANVRAGSTRFNQFVPNNAIQNVQNQLNSTISYSKSWGAGKYNLSVNANHSQNSIDRRVNLQLPTINFSVNTFYPFQSQKRANSDKWYEKIGVSYNTTVNTQASFFDSTFSLRKLLDTTQWGMQHNIPITLALPAVGPIILSPNLGFSERWYGTETLLRWNNAANKLDTTINRGFFTAREVTLGINASTRIFGTFNFKKGNVKAIRHEIKPFVGVSYKPDMARKDHYTVQVNQQGSTQRISRFINSVGGAYGEGRFGGMNFGIDNLFEMKVADKTDSTGKATKKVRLIDGLSINSGYNFLQDSLQLQPFSIQMRSTLWEKVNITATANVDPYRLDALGRRINQLRLPGNFTSANLAISTQLQSKKKDDRDDKKRIGNDATMTPDEQMRQLEYVRQNPAEFVDFNIPWSAQIQFSLNYNRIFNSTLLGFQNVLNANMNLSGDFSLTPKWKFGGNTYFDFKQRRLENLNVFLTREMHCWQMAISLSLGQFRSFSITINPKSGILRDLRINRNRFFYNQ